jgi:hypothetical protein
MEESIKNRLTPEELEILEAALHALDQCEKHFKNRDRANAGIHLANPKWSPITRLTSKSAKELMELLDSSPSEETPTTDSEPT